ncbi:MAG TPA: MarR family winged helix-turn-helix transcriptional regulator [Nocardioidaceae bacterium]|nr:MarR family winged helix-turn-helix transcriptional regulator [Nocardioidaceae bacterium]
MSTTTPPATTLALLEAISRFRRALSASGHRFDRLEPTLRRTDAWLLRYLLNSGDARAGDIAAAYEVDASVVSRQVGCLVSRGLVERRTDPADARASLLTITAEGRDELAEFDRVYARYLGERFEDWSDERLAESAAVLDDVASRLFNNVDAGEDDTNAKEARA